MKRATARKKLAPKTRLPGKKAPAKRPRSNRSYVIDEGLRKMIRQEALRLNMSEEEYLRLVVHFSEVVRTSILPAGLLDGGLIKMLLSNPMMLNMLQGMIGNMVGRFTGNGSGGGNSGSGSGSGSSAMATPSAPGAMRPGMPPMGQLGPGMMPGGMRPQGMPGMGMMPQGAGQGQGAQQGQNQGGLFGALGNLGNLGNLGSMMNGLFGQGGGSSGNAGTPPMQHMQQMRQQALQSPYGSMMPAMPNGSGMSGGLTGGAPSGEGDGEFSMDNLAQMVMQFLQSNPK